MASHSLVVGQEYHPLAVGRDVWEPVVEVVVGNLFLQRSRTFHSPDLHGSGANGIEVDEGSIGRVFGAVVETLGGGEESLVAAREGVGLISNSAVALPYEGQRFAVRRPNMPVGG